jgi:predicted transposase/invertase (TIGR01784 family)
MAHYLDPRNDLVFKKIFGEHPDLLVSFLNALMPLGPEQLIESVEYLPAELIPDNPAKKYSIVDVRCKDNTGRHFIVEMQMVWNKEFFNRMVFNVAKAYVRQLSKGENYDMLRPVYGLGILNENFDHNTEEFYHHYQTINRTNTDEVIEGLEFVLVELDKFRPTKIADKKMTILWLRFLKEVGDSKRLIDDLMANEYTRRAVDLCEEAGFTEGELYAYDKYWDDIRVEHAIIHGSHAEGLAKGEVIGLKKGKAEGIAEGLAKGKAEGLAEGERKAKIQMVENSYKLGFSVEDIALATGLTTEEVTAIIQQN